MQDGMKKLTGFESEELLKNSSDSELEKMWGQRENAGYPEDFIESMRQEISDRGFTIIDDGFVKAKKTFIDEWLKELKPHNRSYVKAAAWTFILAALYVVLHYIPLPTAVPFLEQLGSYKYSYFPSCNILSLGLTPVINAFVCVEIFSLLIRPLNRWRLEGVPGREKLNQCAWIVSAFFAGINAVGTNYIFKSWGTWGPMGFFEGKEFLFLTLNVSALMAGTFLGVWIAQLITRVGIGNGFLILFLAAEINSIIVYTGKDITHFVNSHPDSHRIFSAYLVLALLVLSSVFLWKFIRKGTNIPMKGPGGKILKFEISPMPQSLQIYVWAVYALSMPKYFLSDWGLDFKWLTSGWSHIALETLLVFLFGWLFYGWFWGNIELFGLDVQNVRDHVRKREKFLLRRFWRAMAVILAGGFLFWFRFGGDDFGRLSWVIDFAVLVGILAIIQDVLAQWRFWRNHGRGIEVMEMDNVHLAGYLKGLFRAEGVPCHIRSYSYRRLFFIFTPLIKMTLLVPEAEEEKARSLIASVRYQIV